jgi:hypothetical protein
LICIIPARAGSQRIPGKNIKDFHGKPIIAYSIELARESELFDRIIVSTDGEDIARVAEQYGADVHQRPSELARDEVGTQEVVGEVLRDLGVHENLDVCALYATSPLLTLEDFLAGEWLLTHGDVCCTYSIDIKGEPTGGFYFAPAWFFMDEGWDPYEQGVGMYTSDMDINDMVDWTLAEKIYEERKWTHKNSGRTRAG